MYFSTLRLLCTERDNYQNILDNIVQIQIILDWNNYVSACEFSMEEFFLNENIFVNNKGIWTK